MDEQHHEGEYEELLPSTMRLEPPASMGGQDRFSGPQSDMLIIDETAGLFAGQRGEGKSRVIEEMLADARKAGLVAIFDPKSPSALFVQPGIRVGDVVRIIDTAGHAAPFPGHVIDVHRVFITVACRLGRRCLFSRATGNHVSPRQDNWRLEPYVPQEESNG